jgi:hypothetical protein
MVVLELVLGMYPPTGHPDRLVSASPGSSLRYAQCHPRILQFVSHSRNALNQNCEGRISPVYRLSWPYLSRFCSVCARKWHCNILKRPRPPLSISLHHHYSWLRPKVQSSIIHHAFSHPILHYITSAVATVSLKYLGVFFFYPVCETHRFTFISDWFLFVLLGSIIICRLLKMVSKTCAECRACLLWLSTKWTFTIGGMRHVAPHPRNQRIWLVNVGFGIVPDSILCPRCE